MLAIISGSSCGEADRLASLTLRSQWPGEKNGRNKNEIVPTIH